MALVTVRWYLPFFRRLNLTSAYEYLEVRYDGIRKDEFDYNLASWCAVSELTEKSARNVYGHHLHGINISEQENLSGFFERRNFQISGWAEKDSPF